MKMEGSGHRDGAPHDPSTFGIHGMLVFGGERTAEEFSSPVYASHLPMFMAPHKVQVVLRISGDAVVRYAPFVAHFGSTDIYTFRPEAFSIDELDPSGGGPKRKSVSGSLYRGHFERGGSEILDGTSFDVDHVVYYRRFAPPAAGGEHATLRYVCFGQHDQVFLAHAITAPPDFDQLLEITLGDSDGLTDDALRTGITVGVPGRENTVAARLQEGESSPVQVEGTAGLPPRSLALTVVSEHYLETGDLAQAM